MRDIQRRRWSAEEAHRWRQGRPWLCGFNYLPSTAVNSTEMWQWETFDPETIRRELGWAADLGLNACRVFVQFLVWQADPDGLLARLDQFLTLAAEIGIGTLIVLLDDCAFAGREPYLGPQDAPVPGLHNGGWTPSPGPRYADDPAVWGQIEDYVTAVVSRFAEDGRVLCWDVYNEPGNSDRLARSLPLLRASFGWARRASPSQPLTAAVWAWDAPFQEINDFLLAESDVLSYHDYSPLERGREIAQTLKDYGRPLFCTEWMGRTLGSEFATHLPFFQEEGIGCFFWGLVNGRTQTHFSWGSHEGAPPPSLWFHDLLDGAGKPYREEEARFIRALLDHGA